MAGGDARRRRTPDRRGSSRLTGPRLLDRLWLGLLDAGLRPGRGVRDVLPHRRVELADEDDSSDHERRENGEEDAIQGELPGLAGAVALADDGPALILAHRVDLGLVVAGQPLLHGLALDDRVGTKRGRRDLLLGPLGARSRLAPGLVPRPLAILGLLGAIPAVAGALVPPVALLALALSSRSLLLLSLLPRDAVRLPLFASFSSVHPCVHLSTRSSASPPPTVAAATPLAGLIFTPRPVK